MLYPAIIPSWYIPITGQEMNVIIYRKRNLWEAVMGKLAGRVGFLTPASPVGSDASVLRSASI